MQWRQGLVRMGLTGLVAVVAVAPAKTRADEDPLHWDAEHYAPADRAFAVPYPRTVERHRLVFSIDHRAFTPLNEHPAQSLLGFDDGNLKIGLGLRYGVCETLDLSATRFNGTTDSFDTYEFVLRYQIAREQRHGLDGAIVAGFSAFDEPKEEDFYGAYAAAHVGKTVLRRLYPTVGVLHHSDSSGPGKTADDAESSTALVATLNGLVVNRLALVAEGSVPVAGFEVGEPAWAAGPKYSSYGHTFSVVISNTQNISADGLAAGADRLDHPVIGFTITRRL